MNLLVLKGFNNYFNRKIKKYSELTDYMSNSSSYTQLTDINFNPADGVNTELVLGKGSLTHFFDFESTNAPDYLICYTSETVEEVTVNTIKSRWFIKDINRTRAGQFTLRLKRDSIVDNFDTLISCPAYIKKGIVGDDNPYILNNEGIVVNQKLEDQIPLKDGSGSAWLVGYMAKNFGVDDTVSVQVDDISIDYKSIEDIATEVGVSSTALSAALTTNKNNPSYIVNDNIELVSWINYQDNTSLEYKILAGSQDGLDSFTYGTPAPIIQSHNPTSDCYAKEVTIPYSGNLNTTKAINLWKTQCNNNKSAIKAAWETITGHPLMTRKVYTTLKNYADNNILIYKAGVYYTIKIGTVSGPTNTGNLYSASALSSPFSTMCANVISGYNAGLDPTTTTHLAALTGGKIYVNYNELQVNFYLEEVTNQTQVPGLSYTMSSARNACRDQCFDMFAIPYDNIQIKNGGTTLEGIGELSQDLSVKLAQKLVLNNTTYQVYDLQLLPYCPIPEICSNGMIDITNLASTKDYDFITQTGAYVDRYEDDHAAQTVEYLPGSWEGGYSFELTSIPYADVVSWGYSFNTRDPLITQAWDPNGQLSNNGGHAKIMVWGQIPDDDVQGFEEADPEVSIWITYNTTGTVNKSVVIYPKRASFNVTINQSLTLKDEMKVEANCNNYRIVSPNYQGSFDFNVAKNGGNVNQFFAKCTYKPYTPYIRVVPEFSGLYSTNYPKECRGLICGGDFSLGIINDKWQEYQLQNKNYQNIFNREIQNLDINQSIQRTQQYAGGGINVLSSSIAGAGTGAMVGGGWGALAGAVIGGTASGIGLAADSSIMERQLVEQRQFAIDKFGLHLGNIQALPYTLTKVGSFDIDSMVWPFLEYYTCTEEEKQAFRNKITYEGMTLGIVDTLENYLVEGKGYLQADLIRNDSIIDDNHQLEDIYLELSKGVYM